MHCDDLIPLLEPYCKGALEPESRRRIEEHAEICPGCAALLQTMGLDRELYDLLRAPELPVSPRVKSKLFRQLKRRAAASLARAVVVCLAILVVFALLQPIRGNLPPIVRVLERLVRLLFAAALGPFFYAAIRDAKHIVWFSMHSKDKEKDV